MSRKHVFNTLVDKLIAWISELFSNFQDMQNMLSHEEDSDQEEEEEVKEEAKARVVALEMICNRSKQNASDLEPKT